MEGTLPRLVQELLPWLGAISAASLALLVVGGVFGVWFVRRLPEDHFRRNVLPPPGRGGWGLWVARNVAGACLFVAGLLMLVLPGQGLLTLLSALLLVEFPGKHRLERRLLRFGWVLGLLNRVRAGGGRRPLKPPLESVE